MQVALCVLASAQECASHCATLYLRGSPCKFDAIVTVRDIRPHSAVGSVIILVVVVVVFVVVIIDDDDNIESVIMLLLLIAKALRDSDLLSQKMGRRFLGSGSDRGRYPVEHRGEIPSVHTPIPPLLAQAIKGLA